MNSLLLGLVTKLQIAIIEEKFDEAIKLSDSIKRILDTYKESC